MKTRQELLAMADTLIEESNGVVNRDAAHATGLASLAQACVMLAKEMRESKFRDPDDPRLVWDKSKNAWVYDEEANA